jgi:Uma2 family endonuclease
MATPKPRPATYAEIEALPPNMVGEIVHGVLYAHPRPAPRHAVAQASLVDEVVSPFQKRCGGGLGGWVFAVEPELHIDGHVIVPDIAGWRTATLPALPDTAHFEVAPDWVCEILSPSTARLDRTQKLGVYAGVGVGHAWYVDPDARTLEVFALTAGQWLLAATFADTEAVTTPPFAAHTVQLDVLWPMGKS